MLDVHLAQLYGVETRTRVQGVKRNLDRFPADFMFQISDGEFADLRSHNVISRPSKWHTSRSGQPPPCRH